MSTRKKSCLISCGFSITCQKCFLIDVVKSDFYLCCSQTNRSPVPLLLLRTIIFAGCACILVASLMLTSLSLQHWPIYYSTWSLILNTIAAWFGLLVSIIAMINQSRGKNSYYESSGLPCYVHLYWAMFNIAAPISFAITACYWFFLSPFAVIVGPFIPFYQPVPKYEIDFLVDIFIHGVNSVLMFMLLIFSRQPFYCHHVFFPIFMTGIYLGFTYVYFVLGLLDPNGRDTIYPMLDWKKPEETLILAAICALGFIILQIIIVVIVGFRNLFTRPCRRRPARYTTQHIVVK